MGGIMKNTAFLFNALKHVRPPVWCFKYRTQKKPKH